MQPIFDDTPVYILGGGASLADFEWNSRLFRRHCIAVNTAYCKAKEGTAMFFRDQDFFGQHKDARGQHFWKFKGEYVFTTCAALKDAGGRIRYVDPTTLKLTKGNRRFSAENSNAGVQAIVLAHQLGAQRIVLLGFDNAPGHWHDGTHLEHRKKPAAAVYDGYGEDMVKLSRMGLDIVNANEHSALTCFPVIPRDSAF